MVYVYLADGFEEIETVTPIDLLRRAGQKVVTVSVSDTLAVTGARGVPFVADIMLSQADICEADMIILPGGCPGFENLAKSEKVTEHIEYMLDKSRFVAAICGAPAAVLGEKGFLKGYRAVCYPGMEDMMTGAVPCADNVCVDKNIITARAAASAMDFALALVKILCGEKTAQKIKESIVYNGNC